MSSCVHHEAIQHRVERLEARMDRLELGIFTAVAGILLTMCGIFYTIYDLPGQIRSNILQDYRVTPKTEVRR